MIEHLVIFGALGDLTRRYLGPALVELEQAGALPDDFVLTGVAFDDLSDDEFRDRLGSALDEHAAAASDAARRRLLGRLRYVRGDATDPDDVRQALGDEGARAVVYLALPPSVFAPATQTLAQVGFDGVLVIEKPFGHDLASARELNEVVHRCVGEERAFRIDHFLGMHTVQNILGLRFANRFLEPVWNGEHVERVEIVWDETLTLEGRGFYDGVGAVRDVVQNHLLQLLCLVAMEAPSTLDARELRDRKVQLLRDVRRLSNEEVRTRTVRARYTPGKIGDREIPAYVDEEDVDPDRETETFAETELQIDNWRWSGTRFLLRTGKALAEDRKEIIVRFRPVPHGTFVGAPDRPNTLQIGLEPETLALGLNVNAPGEEFALERTELTRDLTHDAIGPYARVLLGALEGDPTLSIRDDEIEESWAIVDPILEAWSADVTPLHEYPAGSAGPLEALVSS